MPPIKNDTHIISDKCELASCILQSFPWRKEPLPLWRAEGKRSGEQKGKEVKFHQDLSVIVVAVILVMGWVFQGLLFEIL